MEVELMKLNDERVTYVNLKITVNGKESSLWNGFPCPSFLYACKLIQKGNKLKEVLSMNKD